MRGLMRGLGFLAFSEESLKNNPTLEEPLERKEINSFFLFQVSYFNVRVLLAHIPGKYSIIRSYPSEV